MRNFKKVLSLVLVMAMVFSFGITGASALVGDFSDEAQIIHKNAVNYLTELKAITGYEDGTFRPEATITRAEFCRLVAVVLSGGRTPILDQNAQANFSDTKGHWAEPEIVLCVDRGIVTGDQGPGGTFRPEDTITAIEASKALLVAAGYNASEEAEGFVGPSWVTKVTTVATEADPSLYSDLDDLDIRSELDRDEAAQMVWNVARIGMVKYELAPVPDGQGGFKTVYNRQSDIRFIANSKPWTILSKYFGVDAVEGIVVANEHAGINRLAVKSGSTTLRVKDDASTTNSTRDASYEVSTEISDLGLSVEVFVKTVDNKLVVIGSAIPTDDNTVVEVPYDKNIRDNANESDVTVENTTPLYVNYNTSAAVDAATRPTTLNGYFNKTVADAKALSGLSTKVIDNNGDGTADYIFVTEPILDKVVAVSGTKITFRTAKDGNDVEEKDITTDITLEKNDIVLVTPISNDRKFIVDAVDTFEGTATGVSDASRKLTIDGTARAKSSVKFGLSTNDVTDATGESFRFNSGNTNNNINFTDDYTFYLDSEGNIIGYEVLEASAAQYALITEAGSNTAGLSDSYVVKAYLSDGTAGQVYEVNTTSKTAGAVTNEVPRNDPRRFENTFVSYENSTSGESGKLRKTDKPVLVRYTINSDDVITLYDAVTIHIGSTGYGAISKNQSTFDLSKTNIGGTGTTTANSKTVIFYVTNNGSANAEYKFTASYVGNRNISDVAQSNTTHITVIRDENASTKPIKAMVIATAKSVTVSDDVRYAYLTGEATGTGADDVYYYDIATVDGVETVACKDRMDTAGFYTYSFDNDDFATFEDVKDSTKVVQYLNAVITDYSDGVASFAGGSVSVDSDLFIYLEKEKQIQMSNDEPKEGVLKSDHDVMATASMLVDDDNNALIIVSNTEAKDRATVTLLPFATNNSSHGLALSMVTDPTSYQAGETVSATLRLQGTIDAQGPDNVKQVKVSFLVNGTDKHEMTINVEDGTRNVDGTTTFSVRIPNDAANFGKATVAPTIEFIV